MLSPNKQGQKSPSKKKIGRFDKAKYFRNAMGQGLQNLNKPEEESEDEIKIKDNFDVDIE